MSSTQGRKHITKHEFYAGLMLAIGEQRPVFLADGPVFHQAFSKVVEVILVDDKYEVEGVQ